MKNTTYRFVPNNGGAKPVSSGKLKKKLPMILLALVLVIALFSSFYTVAEPEYANEIAAIFRRFPQLNVSEVARYVGINKSLLAKYIYGIKKPSDMRIMQIKEALHTIGSQLMAV